MFGFEKESAYIDIYKYSNDHRFETASDFTPELNGSRFQVHKSVYTIRFLSITAFGR